MQHGKLRTIVVPGLSTSSSSSATFPTSVLQEAVAPTLHPASTRSESMCEDAQGNLSHEPAEIEKKKNNKMETTGPYGETRGLICQNGYKNLRRILWMKVFQLTGTHPRVLLVKQFQRRGKKWYRANTSFSLPSRRTETATSA